MNYIEFFRDALVLGRALGVGPGSTEEAIESAWGTEFMEDVHKRGRMKRWDYGLAEFSYKKDVDWVCTGFIIQVHRLAQHGISIVPTAVSRVYGEFPQAISFNVLADEVRDSGASLEEERAPGSGYDMYGIAGTRNHVYVIQDDADTAREGRKPGEIWSISVQALHSPISSPTPRSFSYEQRTCLSFQEFLRTGRPTRSLRADRPSRTSAATGPSSQATPRASLTTSTRCTSTSSPPP